MLTDVRSDQVREGDDPHASPGLRRTERVTSLVIVELPGHADGKGVQVDVCRSERGEFGPAKASERSQQDQSPVAEPDRIGQGVDLRHGQDRPLW